jgi:hypothetical protein
VIALVPLFVVVSVNVLLLPADTVPKARPSLGKKQSVRVPLRLVRWATSTNSLAAHQGRESGQ